MSPSPFEVYEVYEEGLYLHGTKAALDIGELLEPGRESNFAAGRTMNYVYVTATLDAAVWGPELASGEGRGRVCRPPVLPAATRRGSRSGGTRTEGCRRGPPAIPNPDR